MSESKVTGVIHVVEAEKTFGTRGFRKRLVVLEQEDGRFSNYVPVEFTQERCSLVDDLKVGDEVEVSYRLRGRRWDRDGEVKFFVNVEAVEVRKLAEGKRGGADSADIPGEGPEGEDDIPF